MGNCFADLLTWDSKCISVSASPLDSSLTKTFHFANNTKQIIYITKWSTTCGCTVASVSQQILNPGEKGDLTVVYKPGKSTGLQKKPIAIEYETDDQHQYVELVTLDIDIKSAINIDPPVISVPEFPKDTALEINIRAKPEHKLASIEFRSPDTNITGNIHPNDENFQLHLMVGSGFTGVKKCEIAAIFSDGTEKLYSLSVIRNKQLN